MPSGPLVTFGAACVSREAELPARVGIKALVDVSISAEKVVVRVEEEAFPPQARTLPRPPSQSCGCIAISDPKNADITGKETGLAANQPIDRSNQLPVPLFEYHAWILRTTNKMWLQATLSCRMAAKMG